MEDIPSIFAFLFGGSMGGSEEAAQDPVSSDKAPFALFFDAIRRLSPISKTASSEAIDS
jgi:hypothetical protein